MPDKEVKTSKSPNRQQNLSIGPYQISYDGGKKHDAKDFIKKNILSTADMQGLLERFIVEKY